MIFLNVQARSVWSRKLKSVLRWQFFVFSNIIVFVKCWICVHKCYVSAYVRCTKSLMSFIINRYKIMICLMFSFAIQKRFCTLHQSSHVQQYNKFALVKELALVVKENFKRNDCAAICEKNSYKPPCVHDDPFSGRQLHLMAGDREWPHSLLSLLWKMALQGLKTLGNLVAL